MAGTISLCCFLKDDIWTELEDRPFLAVRLSVGSHSAASVVQPGHIRLLAAGQTGKVLNFEVVLFISAVF
jgi:hypothetical protein